jgi:hypothetical protein
MDALICHTECGCGNSCGTVPSGSHGAVIHVLYRVVLRHSILRLRFCNAVLRFRYWVSVHPSFYSAFLAPALVPILSGGSPALA